MHPYKFLIVWLCFLTLSSCQDNKEIKALEDQQKHLWAEEVRLRPYIRKFENLEYLNKLLQEKRKTVEGLKSMHGLISPMLKNVFQRIPAAVYLEEFFYSTGTIDLIVTVPRDQLPPHGEKFLENSDTFKNICYYNLEEKIPHNIRKYRILSDFTPAGKEGLSSRFEEKPGKEETKHESQSEKSKIAWLKDSIRKFREKIARGNKAKENEKRFDEEIKKKFSLLRELEITFPPQIKTKHVLEDIYRTAAESQVKIKRLEIKNEIIEESFSKKPIHLDICASVTQFIHFISTIEKAARIYQLETLYLVMHPDSTSGCYELALKLYVFQDQKSSSQRRINRGRRRR
jgi:Tfp pilus assembly protein PilO